MVARRPLLRAKHPGFAAARARSCGMCLPDFAGVPSPEILVTPTPGDHAVNKILTALHGVKIEGENHFCAAIQVAHAALAGFALRETPVVTALPAHDAAGSGEPGVRWRRLGI